MGDAGQIKEYVLGVEVLVKGESFNPQLDPIARAEAGRLRKKLDEYYQTEGQNDSILIELPKGRYVPVFRKYRRNPPRLLCFGRGSTFSRDGKKPVSQQSPYPWLSLRWFGGAGPLTRSWHSLK
jgi:hypothetical protein